jgi:hypothetical protein
LDLKFLYELAATQAELQIHTTPVAMRVWADRKLTIDGCGKASPPVLKWIVLGAETADRGSG